MNHRALDFASTTWSDGSLPPEREQAVDLTEVSYTRESLGDSRDPNDGQQTLFRILTDDRGTLRWEEWSSDASGITGLQEGHLTQWESIALEHLTMSSTPLRTRVGSWTSSTRMARPCGLLETMPSRSRPPTLTSTKAT